MIHINDLCRVGSDPQLRQAGETPVLGFRAVFDGMKRDDGKETWANLSIFGKRATSLAEHISKGSQLYVVGKLTTREYQHNGETRTSVEVAVDNIRFAGSKQGGNGGGQAPQRRAPNHAGGYVGGNERPGRGDFGGYEGDHDDIPF